MMIERPITLDARGLLAGRRVLVVEDEYFLAEDLAKALKQLGAQVVGPVGDPEEGLDLLAREDIDAAIVDINLRGEMVFQIADQLRSRGIPFAFSTGYEKRVIPLEFQNIEHWEKPVNAGALARSMTRLLR
jgi:two-component SAPR family response regulator